MTVVPVELGQERRYEVTVGDGELASLAALCRDRVRRARRAAVVTQAQIAAQPWFASVDPGLPFEVHTIADGEDAKSLATVESLCRSFARSGLARSDLVVAVGGGVVCDVAGFAAATYHRGVAWCAVATSLLAQVDAAIGGKTGVNLPEGKNLVGAFWQPVGVVCDTSTLSTLPAREWSSGKGEVAKYALLAGAGLAALAVHEQVARCVAFKASVVGEDEREGGRRALLNYGHTLAHALEGAAFTQGTITHGEAVAVGLVYAALLARHLGRIGDDRVEAHRQVVASFGLSAGLPEGSNADALVAFMARDKKATHDLTFVLDGPRGPEVVHGVDVADASAALAELAQMEQPACA